MADESTRKDRPQTTEARELRAALLDIDDVLAEFDAAEALDAAKARERKALRAPFESERKRLQAKLQSIAAARQGRTVLENGAEQRQSSEKRTQGPATKARYDDLIAQISRPKLTMAPKPPQGMLPDSIATVDRDLKLIAKARKIGAKLDGAGEKLQNGWKQANKPKR